MTSGNQSVAHQDPSNLKKNSSQGPPNMPKISKTEEQIEKLLGDLFGSLTQNCLSEGLQKAATTGGSSGEVLECLIKTALQLHLLSIKRYSTSWNEDETSPTGFFKLLEIELKSHNRRYNIQLQQNPQMSGTTLLAHFYNKDIRVFTISLSQEDLTPQTLEENFFGRLARKRTPCTTQD